MAPQPDGGISRGRWRVHRDALAGRAYGPRKPARPAQAAEAERHWVARNAGRPGAGSFPAAFPA